MTGLRTPFLIAAIICLGLVVAIELGSLLVTRTPPSDAALASAVDRQIADGTIDPDERLDVLRDMRERSRKQPPGIAVPSLALFDILVFGTFLLFATPLVITDRVQGKVQGIATLITSLLVFLACVVTFLAALALVTLMIALLLSVPFGTIVYMARWGFFDRGTVTATLAFLTLLKLVGGALLLAAHQNFLKFKMLIVLFVVSLVLDIALVWLLGFVPGVLASIVDVVWAIVTAIVAGIVSLLFLIYSLKSVYKVLRVDRAFA